jgi:hypothetical protein
LACQAAPNFGGRRRLHVRAGPDPALPPADVTLLHTMCRFPSHRCRSATTDDGKSA